VENPAASLKTGSYRNLNKMVPEQEKDKDKLKVPIKEAKRKRRPSSGQSSKSILSG